jgi:hypothetical protein
MQHFSLVRIVAWMAAGVVLVHTGAKCQAQSLRGGEIEIKALATGEERTAQSGLYVMDVYFKPLRMITVELTDPTTGEKKPEYVWYIVYRTFNRKLERPSGEAPPQNALDPEVINPPLFVPEFTLQTTDTAVPKTYLDEIIPEALPVIWKREKGKYLSTVDIVGPIPPASEPGDPNRQGLWGVAMWRGIDPEADRYAVYLTGFSNGIRVVDGPDGQPVIQTKTIMQKYWRPGDPFDRAEPEIRLDGPAQWIYR